MANGIKTYRWFTAPVQGVNKQLPAPLLADEQAADLQNMIIYQGRLRTRPGYAYLCSSVPGAFGGAVHYDTYHQTTSSYGRVLTLLNNSAGRLFRQSGLRRVAYASTAVCLTKTLSNHFWLLSTNGNSAVKAISNLANILSTVDGYVTTAEFLDFTWNNPALVIAWGNTQHNPHPNVAPLCYVLSGRDGLHLLGLSTTDYLSTWSPLSATTSKRPAPVGKIVRNYQGHLTIFNTYEKGISYPWRVRWADAGQATAGHWNSNNYTDLMDTGGPIIQAELLYNQMIIYKTDAIVGMIYLANATATFRFDWYFKDEGLVAPGLLVNLGNSHIFLGTQNVYQFYGGNNIDRLGGPIWDSLQADLDDSQASAVQPVRNRARMVHFRDLRSVALFIPTADAKWPTKAYVYNYDQRFWTIWKTAHNVAGWGEVEQAYDDEVVYLPLTGDTSGHVYQWDGTATQDVASAIAQWFTTKQFASREGPQQHSYYDYLRLAAEANSAADSIGVQYRADGASAWTDAGTLTLSNAGQLKQYDLDFYQAADLLQLRFVTSAAGSRPQIALYGLRESVGGDV